MELSIKGMVYDISAVSRIHSAKYDKYYDLQDLFLAMLKYDERTGRPLADERNTPKFTFWNQKCLELQGLNKGDIITVYFEVKGSRRPGKKSSNFGEKEYVTNELIGLRVEREVKRAGFDV